MKKLVVGPVLILAAAACGAAAPTVSPTSQNASAANRATPTPAPVTIKFGQVGSISAQDTVPEYSLAAFPRTGGHTIKDITVVPLAFPDMIAALANKAIDVAVPTEPTATRILDAGTGVLITRTDVVVPGEQTAVILYSEKFAAQNKDAAVRFMKAYLQGARFYNDAFDKKDPAKRKEAIDILAKGTKLDAALIERVVLPGIDPNGAVNTKSLDAAQQYFVQKGSQTKAIDMSKVVDTSFAD